MQGFVDSNEIEASEEENVFHTKTPLTLKECRNAVQNIFSGTTCYDLIQQSAKVIVFEKTIPCHMAFYALVEHDANAAPIWDPARHTFVAMMTVSDYIRALRLCNAQNISMLEFQQKSIAEIMESSVFQLEHPEFSSVDAEDSIQMMCYYFNRTQYDYVPVVNPDDGSLLSVLGYLDILHLLDEAAKQHPEYFEMSLESMRVPVESSGVVTAPATTQVVDVLGMGDKSSTIGGGGGSKTQTGIPILDANGMVQGIYHKTDVAFVVKAGDPESVLTNMNNLTVDDIFTLHKKQESAGERGRLASNLAVCNVNDSIASVISSMMRARSNMIIVCNEKEQYVGIVTVRAIVSSFFDD